MFYWMNEQQARDFTAALEVQQRIYPRIFASDMLVTFRRNMGFSEDARFMDALRAEAATDQERSLMWRLHVLCWCAENALQLEGDFVECGVWRGFSTAVAARYLEFGARRKTWHLYDTFAGIPADQLDDGHVSPANFQEATLYDSVVRRFASYPNVAVHRGRVPEVLAGTAPGRIAFLHLDMNSSRAEAGALDVLYDRLVPGAYLLLDDYGWYDYRQQKAAADAFLGPRGARVLELPTGQGLLVKPGAPACSPT